VINDTAWTRRFVYVPIGGQLQRRRELQSINAGDALYWGSEAQLTYARGILQAGASVSYVDGLTESLNLRGVLTRGPAQNLSNLLAKGEVSVEPVSGLTLDVRLLFQSAALIRFTRADFIYAKATEPVMQLDASVRYGLHRHFPRLPLRALELYLDGRNLTDARFKQPSGRPAINPTGTPQPPIQLWGGVSAEY
jgi:hypothetical protein